MQSREARAGEAVSLYTQLEGKGLIEVTISRVKN
jgi:hypothetical protein